MATLSDMLAAQHGGGQPDVLGAEQVDLVRVRVRVRGTNTLALYNPNPRADGLTNPNPNPKSR